MTVEHTGSGQKHFDFTTPSTWEKNTARYLKALTRLTGRSFEQVKIEQLREIYYRLISDQVDAETIALVIKYIGEPFGRRYQERLQHFCQLCEGLLDQNPLHLSFGVSIPTYLPLLVAHRDRFQAGENYTITDQTPYRTLLVGALTPLGIIEYIATNRAVSPLAECTILDIEGKTTKEFAINAGVSFVEEDIYRTSLPPDHFATIQTSYLLNQLQAPEQYSPSQQRQELFAQMYELIQPGGLLIMVEPSDPAYNYYQRRLRVELQTVGFKFPVVELAKLFKTRRTLDRFMRGTTTEIDYVNDVITATRTLAISAIKPL